MCILTSCAIHAEFPFICFRKQCIISSWSFTKPAGENRSIKQKFKALKVKLRKRRKKNQNIDLSIKPGDLLTLKLLLSDTTTSKEYIKVVFKYKSEEEKKYGRDSVWVKSSLIVLSKEDKLLMNYYLGRYGISRVNSIQISSIRDSISNKGTEHYFKVKMEKLKKYLIKTGMKSGKVIIIPVSVRDYRTVKD